MEIKKDNQIEIKIDINIRHTGQARACQYVIIIS